jgi:hypothetical protein
MSAPRVKTARVLGGFSPLGSNKSPNVITRMRRIDMSDTLVEDDDKIIEENQENDKGEDYDISVLNMTECSQIPIKMQSILQAQGWKRPSGLTIESGMQTNDLDEEKDGPLVSIRMAELRSLHSAQGKASRIQLDSTSALDLIRKIYDNAASQVELKLDPQTTQTITRIDTLQDGILGLQSLLARSIHQNRRVNDELHALRNSLGDAATTHSDTIERLRGKIAQLEDALEVSRFDLLEFQRITKIRERAMLRKNEGRDQIMAHLEQDVARLQKENAKQLDQIMDFPRKEELIRSKAEQEVRLKAVEFQHKDKERRELVEEMKTLRYWRDRAERAESTFQLYQLHQASLRRQKSQGIEAAIQKEQEFEKRLDSVDDRLDKDMLIRNLERKLKDREMTIKKLREKMAKEHATPLVMTKNMIGMLSDVSRYIFYQKSALR